MSFSKTQKIIVVFLASTLISLLLLEYFATPPYKPTKKYIEGDGSRIRVGDTLTLEPYEDTKKYGLISIFDAVAYQARLDSICDSRGHVWNDKVATRPRDEAYTKIIDLDSISIRYGFHRIYTLCDRCKKMFDKVDTLSSEIIWRKK